ncbi:DEAD/DEAH box helicase [Enterococcus sp. 2201sp1_2201st1_B8_2201SCRN_220225]|uniref:DEAD/DEAH box helicase n=2 Tax=unclassified Enterococcus TaxID=2608891 RepID=UPI0034A141A4
MTDIDLVKKAIYKGFIDKNIAGSKLDPKFIVNQPKQKEFFLNILQEEMDNCQTFTFSVAFVTQDGLNALKSHLSDLADRGLGGRLLTSTYLSFNDPYVFYSLLAIPNLEVRISRKNGFHSKGYLFEHGDYQSFVIGSSNLTMNALKLNYEWNILLTTRDHGEIISDIRNYLDEEWEQAIPLTKQWITRYEQVYKPQLKVEQVEMLIDPDVPEKERYVYPNKMQQLALQNLKELRESGERKGLVISATGTGKTYLAGFDVAQVRPEHMLFIVHREQILNKAKESFRRILGGPASDYGVLSGTAKDLQAKYLFAIIQSISRDKYLHQFARESFDYVLIDEVHKAGATSYLKVLDYFDPKFLLGMTATPERTDDFNIFELFDYNIAYEIRLQEALEEDLLCPFHYFGVTDYATITESTELRYLANTERVQFLLKKINYYGCSRNDPKALVFCSRKEEAQKLCQLFNEQNAKSAYLSGDHSIEEREQVVEQLEDGKIQYIFTVDIFNEGIDIPKVNQVIMLRNTQSSIIFIQQLGRGLRKDPSKDFVTIIDFIGNYQNNYLIPMALSGDITRNKNNLRKDTFDTTYITGLSSVNFEVIAKERIYQSIDAIKLDDAKSLREIFKNLKNRINRVPYLKDFLEHGVVDPLIIATKYSSYYDFLVKMNENEGMIAPEENKQLMFVSRELLPGMRRHELLLLKELLKKSVVTMTDFRRLLMAEGLSSDSATLDSVLRTLSLAFYTGTSRKNYSGAELIGYHDEKIFRSTVFERALKNSYYAFLVNDLVEAALIKNAEYEAEQPLTLYKKYRRRDVLRLLNWQEQMVDQNIGGYTYKDGKFVIFMTLEKGENFKGARMAYEDTIIDPQHILYYTKSPRTINSPEVKILLEPTDWEIYMFIKKSDDEGTDFYFMGTVNPIRETIHELMKPTQDGTRRSVVEAEFLLEHPLDSKFYRYLIGIQ